MLKLGYDIRHEEISSTTFECLCWLWSQHADDASTIQDVDLYSGNGEERSSFTGTRFSRQGINSDLVPVLRPPT